MTIILAIHMRREHWDFTSNKYIDITLNPPLVSVVLENEAVINQGKNGKDAVVKDNFTEERGERIL